jgi:hypothetical protein
MNYCSFSNFIWMTSDVAVDKKSLNADPNFRTLTMMKNGAFPGKGKPTDPGLSHLKKENARLKMAFL